MLRAVCATKFPTFTLEDGQRFRGLLKDLFPDVIVALPANADLEQAIRDEAEAMKIELLPQQVRGVTGQGGARQHLQGCTSSLKPDGNV